MQKEKKIRTHIGKHRFIVLYIYILEPLVIIQNSTQRPGELFLVKEEVMAFCEPCVPEQLLQIFSCLSSCFQVNKAHKQSSYLLGLNSICCSET